MNPAYLKAAADAIERQALGNPALAIPVDPEVADHMGAFEEPALEIGDLDDLDDDEGAVL